MQSLLSQNRHRVGLLISEPLLSHLHAQRSPLRMTGRPRCNDCRCTGTLHSFESTHRTARNSTFHSNFASTRMQVHTFTAVFCLIARPYSIHVTTAVVSCREKSASAGKTNSRVHTWLAVSFCRVALVARCRAAPLLQERSHVIASTTTLGIQDLIAWCTYYVYIHSFRQSWCAQCVPWQLYSIDLSVPYMIVTVHLYDACPDYDCSVVIRHWLEHQILSIRQFGSRTWYQRFSNRFEHPVAICYRVRSRSLHPQMNSQILQRHDHRHVCTYIFDLSAPLRQCPLPCPLRLSPKNLGRPRRGITIPDITSCAQCLRV